MNQKKRVVLTVCAAAAIVSLVPFRSLPSATMVKGQEMATALPEVTPDAGATSTPVPTEIPATPAVPVKKLPSVKKVKVVRFSTHSVKLTWKKQKKPSIIMFLFQQRKMENIERSFQQKIMSAL